MSAANRRAIACGRCRVERTEPEWSALPPVGEVDADALASVVTHWPHRAARVVVRACSCGSPIARLALRPQVEVL